MSSALAQKQLLHSLPSTHIMLGIYGICTRLFMPFTDPQPGLTLTLLSSDLLWIQHHFCLRCVFKIVRLLGYRKSQCGDCPDSNHDSQHELGDRPGSP